MTFDQPFHKTNEIPAASRWKMNREDFRDRERQIKKITQVLPYGTSLNSDEIESELKEK